MSSFLYSQKVIEMIAFTYSNSVSFTFDNMPTIHQKIIVRTRVFTECSSSQDRTIKMTLTGPTDTIVNNTLTSNTESIIEGEVLHTASTFTMMIEFGTQSETCRKIIQDISLFYEKCASFCGSNDCPANTPYYRHPVDAKCVLDCPDGYT